MDIINKANELAKLIEDSKELQTLRDAEAALMLNPEALDIINDFNATREEYITMLNETDDPAQLEGIKNTVVTKSELLQANELTKNYIESKTTIDIMFRTISDILSRAVNGDEQDGCSSSDCGSCGCGCK